MNVNLLQNNPDWRWYILFVAVLLLLTLTGWLVFKYNPVSGLPCELSDIFHFFLYLALQLTFDRLSIGLSRKQAVYFIN
jgi:hypothetical protein